MRYLITGAELPALHGLHWLEFVRLDWPLANAHALSQLSTAAAPVTSPSSQHTHSYDVLNRLTGESTTSSATRWNYEAADNLTGITDSLTGTSTLVYDTAHELTNLSTTMSGKGTHNLTLSYNSNDNRTSQNDSVTGKSASFGYDQANRMTSCSQRSTKYIVGPRDCPSNRSVGRRHALIHAGVSLVRGTNGYSTCSVMDSQLIDAGALVATRHKRLNYVFRGAFTVDPFRRCRGNTA